jgi:hypothetical protein
MLDANYARLLPKHKMVGGFTPKCTSDRLRGNGAIAHCIVLVLEALAIRVRGARQALQRIVGVADYCRCGREHCEETGRSTATLG